LYSPASNSAQGHNEPNDKAHGKELGGLKKVAILQSNYIPWKGYFDLINSVDEFIFFDDVQYTRRDWRNRNKIKTANGLSWLTIPVNVKGQYHQKIRDTKISDKKWANKHWQTIQHNYGKAPYYSQYRDIIEDLYRKQVSSLEFLSEINFTFIKAINELLSIRTCLRWSDEYALAEGKSERLLEICKASQASHYISGPAAKDYLDDALFASSGIQVDWMDYANYPEYVQDFGAFEHSVTILDVLFSMGPKACDYVKCYGG